MQCPKCQVEMESAEVVLFVSSKGRTTSVEGFRCPECGEQFVGLNEEAVPAEEYEAMSGAPDSPMTDVDVDRMFEDAI